MKALYRYNPSSRQVVHGVNCDVIYTTCALVAPDGFYDSPQACAAAAEGAPPTREEIEAKADELGIKYPANISDAKLLAKINEKA